VPRLPGAGDAKPRAALVRTSICSLGGGRRPGSRFGSLVWCGGGVRSHAAAAGESTTPPSHRCVAIGRLLRLSRVGSVSDSEALGGE
jgi:hypothetical protein